MDSVRPTRLSRYPKRATGGPPRGPQGANIVDFPFVFGRCSNSRFLSAARKHGLAIHGFGARSPNPWIGGGALPKGRPVPPRSPEKISDFRWKRDPSLIHLRYRGFRKKRPSCLLTRWHNNAPRAPNVNVHMHAAAAVCKSGRFFRNDSLSPGSNAPNFETGARGWARSITH